MKNTVPFPVSDKPVTQDGAVAWVNGEAQKLLRQLRTFANMLSWDYATVETTGSGVGTDIWTSPEMPTDACWTILAIVTGVTTSGAAQRNGSGRVATFESTSGTVAQVSTTTNLWVHETDALVGMGFSVSTSTRKVTVQVNDNGTSPMRYTAVIVTGEALPA